MYENSTDRITKKADSFEPAFLFFLIEDFVAHTRIHLYTLHI